MLDANHRGDPDASLDALQRIYDEAVCASTMTARAGTPPRSSPCRLPLPGTSALATRSRNPIGGA